MAIDMTQFYQVFFEESAEHLATMESLLGSRRRQSRDPGELNAISGRPTRSRESGTFGFTDLAETTHILENLLDRIRKQELELRADIWSIPFLEAGDLLGSPYSRPIRAGRDGMGHSRSIAATAASFVGGRWFPAPPVTAATSPICAARSAAGNSRVRHPIVPTGRLAARGWGKSFRRRPEALGYVGGARKTRSGEIRLVSGTCV